MASGNWYFPSVVVKSQKMPGGIYSRATCMTGDCWRLPEEVSNTSPGRRRALRELTGRLALLSELGHSFLIIYNLYLQCTAQHEECFETGNSWTSNLCCFVSGGVPTQSPPRARSNCRWSAGPWGKAALCLCSLLTSSSPKNNIGSLLV